MESIEQLKQDNVKLTERLNNAAKFFREQKAQIEALTKENKELKDQINRTPQEEVIDAEKWNALVTEKENLNEQLKDKDVEITNQKDALQSCYNQLHDYEMMTDSLNKENEELKAKSENFETVAANKQKLIEKLENDIDSKDKAYQVLQDTYNEVWAEKEKITKQFEEQETQIQTLKEKFKDEGKNAVANKVLLDEANEKIDKLNKLYDNCENEKLAAQADYDALKEKYNELKINAEANEEVARNYEEIYEEYEKYKEFINALFTKAEEVNITWKTPEKTETSKPKSINQEQVKQESTKPKRRIINQEMEVQGGMSFNI